MQQEFLQEGTLQVRFCAGRFTEVVARSNRTEPSGQGICTWAALQKVNSSGNRPCRQIHGILPAATTHVSTRKVPDTWFLTRVSHVFPQITMALQKLKAFSETRATPSVVLVGDFNTPPYFPAYDVITTGKFTDKNRVNLEARTEMNKLSKVREA